MARISTVKGRALKAVAERDLATILRYGCRSAEAKRARLLLQVISP
jgi:hypothetical protein